MASDAPQKASPWDAVGMKRLLDEALVETFHREAGLTVNRTHENLRLLIMVLACASAATAQFYPLPLASSRWVQAGLVVLYFSLSSLLELMYRYVDKGRISASKPVAAAGGGAPVVFTLAAVMASRFDDVYEVTLSAGGGVLTTVRTSLGDFFTKEGELSEGAVLLAVKKHLVPAVQTVLAKKEQ